MNKIENLYSKIAKHIDDESFQSTYNSIAEEARNLGLNAFSLYHILEAYQNSRVSKKDGDLTEFNWVKIDVSKSKTVSTLEGRKRKIPYYIPIILILILGIIEFFLYKNSKFNGYFLEAKEHYIKAEYIKAVEKIEKAEKIKKLNKEQLTLKSNSKTGAVFLKYINKYNNHIKNESLDSAFVSLDLAEKMNFNQKLIDVYRDSLTMIQETKRLSVINSFFKSGKYHFQRQEFNTALQKYHSLNQMKLTEIQKEQLEWEISRCYIFKNLNTLFSIESIDLINRIKDIAIFPLKKWYNSENVPYFTFYSLKQDYYLETVYEEKHKLIWNNIKITRRKDNYDVIINLKYYFQDKKHDKNNYLLLYDKAVLNRNYMLISLDRISTTKITKNEFDLD